MKKQSIFTVLLAVCVLLQSAALAAGAVEYGAELDPAERTYEQAFSDVPTSHWAFAQIAELAARGAINGYPDKQFRPGNTVSRAEFAKIMLIAGGLEPETTSNVTFADVPTSHWVHPFLEGAKSYMTGYMVNGQYLFKPGEAALREDIAVAVVKLKGFDVNRADLSIPSAMFSDYASISEACRPYVAVAVERSLISGYPDGTFRAQQTITRAEAATLLWRAFQYGNDNKVVEGGENTKTDTPTPTETAPTPTPSPSPTPDDAPTPTPTPAKPLTVDTIAKASIDTNLGERSMIYDGMAYAIDKQDNLYYADTSENAIIKVNVYTKARETLLAMSDLDIDTDEFALSSFEVQNVVFDNYANRLLVQGRYANVNPPNYTGGYSLVTLAINAADSNIELLDPGTKRIVAVLDDGSFIDSGIVGSDVYNYVISNFVQKSEGIFYAVESGGTSYKYYLRCNNFASRQNMFQIQETDDSTVVLSAGKVVVCGTYGITILNYNGKIIGGKYTSDDVRVIDKSAFSFDMVGGHYTRKKKPLLTQREDVVYYDTSVGAFRLIVVEGGD
jgi:hypothetical protein